MVDVAAPLDARERELLSLVVGDVEPRHVTRPTRGQDNRIAVVDDRWVVRVADSDDARSYHANEVAVLRAMPRASRVPRVRAALHHGIVYDLIDGERLTADRWHALAAEHRLSVADDLRSVLDALHALPLDVLPEPAEQLDRDWALTSIDHCAPVPPRAPLGFDVDVLAARFADAWSLEPPPAAVIHVDLKPDNLLVAGDRASVIDFGGVCVGDPAIDYGVLTHHFGDSLLDALGMSSTPLAARARCYADLYHLRRCTRGWTRSASAS